MPGLAAGWHYSVQPVADHKDTGLATSACKGCCRAWKRGASSAGLHATQGMATGWCMFMCQLECRLVSWVLALIRCHLAGALQYVAQVTAAWDVGTTNCTQAQHKGILRDGGCCCLAGGPPPMASESMSPLPGWAS